ncbi:hypothetical protein FA15DRAFT_190994 [Coprinopsis marcescibilis]|uniref:Replication protein A C-terminal domain-containing protein n=1 Tax=Coprinopsis marcescibilis TaxID=230819 RepID=A0A5C3LMP3_COPMA|nr:hypothetical protein FA15DRAFT_190994 [Coprinopsis marcescibilis]
MTETSTVSLAQELDTLDLRGLTQNQGAGLRRVTAAQIRRAKLIEEGDDKNGVYSLESGNPFKYVEIVANLYDIHRLGAYNQITLIDSTGGIKANYWGPHRFLENMNLTPGCWSYVRVFGKLETYSDKNIIKIIKIKLISDAADIYRHILDILRDIQKADLDYESSQDGQVDELEQPKGQRHTRPGSLSQHPKQFSSRSLGVDIPPLHMTRSINVEDADRSLVPVKEPSALAESISSVSSARTRKPSRRNNSQPTPTQAATVDDLKDGILEYLSRYEDQEDGCHIQELANGVISSQSSRNVHVTSDNLESALQGLVDDGYVYTTISESHFAKT